MCCPKWSQELRPSLPSCPSSGRIGSLAVVSRVVEAVDDIAAADKQLPVVEQGPAEGEAYDLVTRQRRGHGPCVRVWMVEPVSITAVVEIFVETTNDHHATVFELLHNLEPKTTVAIGVVGPIVLIDCP